MKTGMEYPLLGMVVLAVLFGIWSAWQGMQLSLSVAAVDATAIGQAVPQPVATAAEWIVKAIVGALISGAVIAGITALIVWARGQMRTQDMERGWQSGPNAKWARVPGQEKPMSEAALMRMMLMRQMGMEPRGRRGSPRAVEDDNEPMFRF